jgi:hypothetical protein
MNDSLADILGIVVDGGTVVYVGYKTGRWVLENREKLIRHGQHRRTSVTDRLHPSDSHTQLLTGGGIESLASVGGGTLLQEKAMGTSRGRSSVSGVLSVTYPLEKAPAWEELLWWYLRVR